MRVRGIDGDNDWLFGKGQNDYKKDLEAVGQNIKTRLQSHLGNCFFALNAGIDWVNLLGSKQEAELRLAISSIILNTTGVTGFVLLTYSLDEQRNISLQYEVQTIYSENISDTFQFSVGV